MVCNFKVATIVVATLAITFSSLYLVKLCIQAEQPQKIDDGGLVAPPKTEEGQAEPWGARPSPTAYHRQPAQARYDEISAKLNRKSTKSQKIVGIIVTVTSILVSFLVFGAVSDDHEYNQCKRHLILPFITFHSLTTFLHFIAAIYVTITYREYMDVLLIPVLVYAAFILVTFIGISFVIAYYRSLSRSAGFSYAQMEDVQKPMSEVKVPLA